MDRSGVMASEIIWTIIEMAFVGLSGAACFWVVALVL